MGVACSTVTNHHYLVIHPDGQTSELISGLSSNLQLKDLSKSVKASPGGLDEVAFDRQKAVVQHSLDKLPPSKENGSSWYRWLFTKAPAARNFFKGAENIEPSAVADSERFQKQGVRFITWWHDYMKCKSTTAARKQAKSLVVGHRRYRIFSVDLYAALGNIFIDFLDDQVGLTNQEKEAWQEVYKTLMDQVRQVLYTDLLLESLQNLQPNPTNGTDWYKWLFNKAPEVRAFFIGAENITAEQVKKSERFEKQGTRFLTKMHEFAAAAHDEEKLRKLAADLVEGHKDYKIQSAGIYKALGGIWLGFMESKTKLTQEQKEAWERVYGWVVEEAERMLPP